MVYTLLTEQREVRNRWKDYSKGLLEGEVRGADMRSDSVGRDRSIVEEITEEEITRDVWKLRSGRASGVCGMGGGIEGWWRGCSSVATGDLQYGLEDRCGPIGLAECYYCTNT